MTALPQAPGWYGKLPSLGDFASRRLPPEFIEPWDLWLGERIAALRVALGAGWLDAYLSSPTWRFVLMPGAMPGALPGLPIGQAWAGVLMPSVDRVGRYFPLTLATPVALWPGPASALEPLLAWLQQLEDLALAALQDDWRIDQIEQALQQLPAPPQRATVLPAEQALAQALQQPSGFVAIDGRADPAGLAALWAQVLGDVAPGWRQALAGRSCWMADGPAKPRLLVSLGLPDSAAFVRMFGANGAAPDDA